MGLTPSGLAVVLFWDLLKWTCSSVVGLKQVDLLQCCGTYSNGLTLVLWGLLKWTYSSVVGHTEVDVL